MTKNLLLLPFLPVLLGAMTLTAEDAKTGVTLTEKDDRLRIELNGEHFTDYIIKGEDRFFPLFYPVLGPGQVPMTRKYPLEIVEGEDTDHPHHQSLWFAHSHVNGHSFWAIRQYRDRKPGKQVHRGFKEIVSGKEKGHFVSENDYVADDGTLIMSDTRTVRFYAPSEPMAPRLLDITITFRATNGDVTFGDDKDAGMAIRVASDLQVERRSKEKNNKLAPAAGHILNSEGIKDGETWGKRARWVDAYGEVDGEAVGIAILDHPENPRHPTYWHARTYGLITANVFGKRFFEKLDDPKAGEMILPDGETVTFRWRFAFHRGDPTQADVEALFKAFAAE
ncbi:MAG: hypothetical protein GXX91_04405 [Verrucomicrobiaceae bacterium]|nr:hypothetical protein [Verrucomicrobiaceae bacterium]